MQKREKKGGFTLVEMLACLAFLSLAVYPMLTCITWSLKTALQTQDRMWVEGLVEDSIETQRGTALTTALTAGTTTTTSTPSGMSCQVSVKTVIALVTGYTDLYSVTVTGTWTDTLFNNNQSVITLVTYMRAPHV